MEAPLLSPDGNEGAVSPDESLDETTPIQSYMVILCGVGTTVLNNTIGGGRSHLLDSITT